MSQLKSADYAPQAPPAVLTPVKPHERDESSDSGVGAPNDLMRRAHDDAVSGRPGTDKGEATDAVYRRNLRDDTPGSERD